jgi:hypothetical protein
VIMVSAKTCMHERPPPLSQGEVVQLLVAGVWKRRVFLVSPILCGIPYLLSTEPAKRELAVISTSP